jgi:hypothetical protein
MLNPLKNIDRRMSDPKQKLIKTKYSLSKFSKNIIILQHQLIGDTNSTYNCSGKMINI